MIQYRKDIDGLRTLAVLPVLLFHAGIPGFGGGFVGVDVFFVISGFLITSILLKDLAEDKFSLAVFYERRARRILPALVAVILFCIGVCYWLSIHSVLNGLARSIVWLTLFSSNIFFKKEFGYFDAEATTKPLLHTWSLSVEEQFYILFPVMLFFGWKYARRYLGIGLVALTVASFAASIWGLRKDPSGAFYYLHFRAWEMGMGAWLAFAFNSEIKNVRLPKLPQWGKEIISLVGLCGIVIPVFFYTEQTRFPGLAALPPCLGTFLLIWTNAESVTLVGRLLSTKLAVGIGLLSYSLYLWHWPLLVFGTLRKGEKLTPWEGAAALGFSLAAAWLSVRFVEKPFREKRLLANRRHILVTSTIVLVIMGSASFTISKLNLLYDSQSISNLLGEPRNIAYDFPNMKTWEVAQGIKVYSVGDNSKPGVLLLGDSFANHWASGLVQWGEANDIPVHVQAIGSTVPLIDCHVPEAETKYNIPIRQRNQSYGVFMDQLKVKHVIIAASWRPYINPRDKLLPMVTLYHGDKTSSNMAEQCELVAQQLDKTVQFFNSRGCKVWLMLPPPDYTFNVPMKLAALVRSQSPISDSYMPIHVAEERRKLAFDLLQGIVAKHQPAEVELLDPLKFFCRDGYCFTVDDEQSLYIDDAHLSYYGSLLAQQVFQPIAVAEGIEPAANQGLAAGKSATTKQ